jgi:hypothetical protein
MSWSENRISTGGTVDIAKINRQIEQVNSVLLMLSRDEDLQDDLKMPIVQKALFHWTGVNRLKPEEAEKLQESRRVLYVFGKLQLLQAVCREAKMAVPLDHLMNGSPQLHPSLQKKLLGDAHTDRLSPITTSTSTAASTVQVEKAEATTTTNSHSAVLVSAATEIIDKGTPAVSTVKNTDNSQLLARKDELIQNQAFDASTIGIICAVLFLSIILTVYVYT